MSKLALTAILTGATLIGLIAAGVASGDSDDHDWDDDHDEYEYREYDRDHERDHDRDQYREESGRYDDDRDEHDRRGWIRHRPDVAPVDNPVYAEECGACHMAYQPGLLPSAAWRAVMSTDGLIDHYGEDASLGEEPRQSLKAYLIANAAERSEPVRARAFAVPAGQADAARGELPRITRTVYFLRKHDDVPARMVVDNPDVGSFSQCNACHQGADKGIYDDDQVKIPGFGRWDD